MAREDIRAFLYPVFDTMLLYSSLQDREDALRSLSELEDRSDNLTCQMAHYLNQRVLLGLPTGDAGTSPKAERNWDIHDLNPDNHTEVVLGWRLTYSHMERLYQFLQSSRLNYLNNTDTIFQRIVDNTHLFLEAEGINRAEVTHEDDCPGEKYDTICYCQFHFLFRRDVMEGKPLSEVTPEQAERYAAEFDVSAKPYFQDALKQLFRQRAIYEANLTLFLQNMMHVLIDFNEWGPGKDSPYFTLFDGSNNHHVTSSRVIPFINSSKEYIINPVGVDEPSPFLKPHNLFSIIAQTYSQEPREPGVVSVADLALNPALFEADTDQFSVVDPQYQPRYGKLLKHCINFIPALSGAYFTNYTQKLSPPVKLSPQSIPPTMFIQPPHTVSVRERKTIPKSLTLLSSIEQTCASYLAGMLSQSKIPPEILRNNTGDLLWKASEDFFTVAVAITHHHRTGNTMWVTTNWGYGYLPTGWNTCGANPYYYVTPNSVTTTAVSLPPGQQIHRLIPFLPEGTTLLGVASNDPQDVMHVPSEIIQHYWHTTGYPVPTLHPLLGLGYTQNGDHALDHLYLQQEARTNRSKLLWATSTFQDNASTAIENLCREYHHKTLTTTSEEYATMLCEDLAEQARRYLPHIRASSYATKHTPSISDPDIGLSLEQEIQLERAEHLARTIKILDFFTTITTADTHDLLYTAITTQTHTPTTTSTTIETTPQAAPCQGDQ